MYSSNIILLLSCLFALFSLISAAPVASPVDLLERIAEPEPGFGGSDQDWKRGMGGMNQDWKRGMGGMNQDWKRGGGIDKDWKRGMGGMNQDWKPGVLCVELCIVFCY
ncbi:hypothetical protein PNOK_0177700 [Pyrrhoderma noxium]|uniref:Uncharacterized protein n=1 Tax=Pyrrhoderma noxium TaxID=2282107 RepID=A0A286UQH3_9AGAM|nr:hypothetical protein PNOK_0177700 [Pyrrhoderma noxium]